MFYYYKGRLVDLPAVLIALIIAMIPIGGFLKLCEAGVLDPKALPDWFYFLLLFGSMIGGVVLAALIWTAILRFARKYRRHSAGRLR